VEEVGPLPVRARGEAAAGLQFVHFDLVVVVGAMGEHLAAIREGEDGDGELVGVGAVEAAVDLAEDLTAVKDQALGAQALVNHGKAAGR
jgi:hypothetical protein